MSNRARNGMMKQRLMQSGGQTSAKMATAHQTKERLPLLDVERTYTVLAGCTTGQKSSKAGGMKINSLIMEQEQQKTVLSLVTTPSLSGINPLNWVVRLPIVPAKNYLTSTFVTTAQPNYFQFDPMTN
ncbi:unnamed protein product [Ranitomeya imitator]|uniref:Uncharacterized protein n=1 Tax=Ranitomeya imitator TaxID=111125 RepID=A0ABN9MCR1_9NEOB|nr:unnamed protein product [Ranitomeya imitator]